MSADFHFNSRVDIQKFRHPVQLHPGLRSEPVRIQVEKHIVKDHPAPHFHPVKRDIPPEREHAGMGITQGEVPGIEQVSFGGHIQGVLPAGRQRQQVAAVALPGPCLHNHRVRVQIDQLQTGSQPLPGL